MEATASLSGEGDAIEASALTAPIELHANRPDKANPVKKLIFFAIHIRPWNNNHLQSRP